MLSKFARNLRYDPKNLVSGLVVLLLVLLSSVGMPSVPNFMVTLMGNTAFKLVYMTCILFTFNYSAKYALLLSLVFILLLQTINNFQKTKLNNTLTGALSNIAHSASDSASDLISDAGKIFTSVGDTISDVVSEASNYLSKELFTDEQKHVSRGMPVGHPEGHPMAAAVHPMVAAVHPMVSSVGHPVHEGFESEPADVTHYVDQYTGKPFSSSLGNEYDKNDAFFSATGPQPLADHDSLAPYSGQTFSDVNTNELLNPELTMHAPVQVKSSPVKVGPVKAGPVKVGH